MSNSDQPKSCCLPARGNAAYGGPAPDIPPSPQEWAAQAIGIPGGTALIGTQTPRIPDDGENPLRRQKIKLFRMAPTTVTNARFQAFVDATGYVTEAEHFGWSFVFWAQVPESVGATQAVAAVEW